MGGSPLAGGGRAGPDRWYCSPQGARNRRSWFRVAPATRSPGDRECRGLVRTPGDLAVAVPSSTGRGCGVHAPTPPRKSWPCPSHGSTGAESSVSDSPSWHPPSLRRPLVAAWQRARGRVPEPAKSGASGRGCHAALGCLRAWRARGFARPAAGMVGRAEQPRSGSGGAPRSVRSHGGRIGWSTSGGTAWPPSCGRRVAHTNRLAT